MNLEAMCHDSLDIASKHQNYSLQEEYDFALADMKSYARLKNNYSHIDTSLFSSLEKEKCLYIQNALLQKENWYTQEFYSVVDIISNQAREAKKLQDYKSILVDCYALEKLFLYVEANDYLQKKHRDISSFCIDKISSFTAPKKRTPKSVNILPPRNKKLSFPIESAENVSKLKDYVYSKKQISSYIHTKYNSQKNKLSLKPFIVASALIVGITLSSVLAMNSFNYSSSAPKKTITIVSKKSLVPLTKRVTPLKTTTLPLTEITPSLVLKKSTFTDSNNLKKSMNLLPEIISKPAVIELSAKEKRKLKRLEKKRLRKEKRSKK